MDILYILEEGLEGQHVELDLVTEHRGFLLARRVAISIPVAIPITITIPISISISVTISVTIPVSVPTLIVLVAPAWPCVEVEIEERSVLGLLLVRVWRSSAFLRLEFAQFAYVLYCLGTDCVIYHVNYLQLIADDILSIVECESIVWIYPFIFDYRWIIFRVNAIEIYMS